MTTESDVPLWEHLETLVKEEKGEELAAALSEMNSEERSLALSRLDFDQLPALFRLLGPEEAAELTYDLADETCVRLLARVKITDAAKLLEKLPSDRRVDLLEQLPAQRRELVLQRLEDQKEKDARRLLSYPSETTGGLMATEMLSYEEDFTVSDVLKDLRENAEKYSDFEVQYAYITDTQKRLTGVLRMRDLLFAPKNKRVAELMIPRPLSVPVTMPLSKLLSFFEDHEFFGVPVVDSKNRLIGVLEREAVRQAANRVATRNFLEASGIVGGEELRSMPTRVRASRRLSWLSINIVLNIIAASVIAFYQDTLEQVIALAVFLPIISDMSGCSGNQAVAVSIRELALGLVKPKEYVRVFMKESIIGVINGLLLGLLLGGVAALWKSNIYLGIVVGGSMMLNTTVAVTFGGLVPLIMKRLRLDPALVSGPLLTTVTDMCGFFFVLSFATVALQYLV